MPVTALARGLDNTMHILGEKCYQNPNIYLDIKRCHRESGGNNQATLPGDEYVLCIRISRGLQIQKTANFVCKAPPPTYIHTHHLCQLILENYLKINLINMFWQCCCQGKPWENLRNSLTNENFVPVFFKHMWCSTGRNRSLPNYRQGESPKAIFPPWPHSRHTFLLLYMYLLFS